MGALFSHTTYTMNIQLLLWSLTFMALATLSNGFSVSPANRSNRTRDIVEVEDCGSTAEVISFDFTECTELPCVVVHGNTYYSWLKLKPTAHTDTLTCKLSAYVGPIELPFNGCVYNQCDGALLDGDCPLETGEFVKAELKFEILPLYPSLSLTAVPADWRQRQHCYLSAGAHYHQINTHSRPFKVKLSEERLIQHHMKIER